MDRRARGLPSAHGPGRSGACAAPRAGRRLPARRLSPAELRPGPGRPGRLPGRLCLAGGRDRHWRRNPSGEGNAPQRLRPTPAAPGTLPGTGRFSRRVDEGQSGRDDGTAAVSRCAGSGRSGRRGRQAGGPVDEGGPAPGPVARGRVRPAPRRREPGPGAGIRPVDRPDRRALARAARRDGPAVRPARDPRARGRSDHGEPPVPADRCVPRGAAQGGGDPDGRDRHASAGGGPAPGRLGVAQRPGAGAGRVEADCRRAAETLGGRNEARREESAGRVAGARAHRPRRARRAARFSACAAEGRPQGGSRSVRPGAVRHAARAAVVGRARRRGARSLGAGLRREGAGAAAAGPTRRASPADRPDGGRALRGPHEEGGAPGEAHAPATPREKERGPPRGAAGSGRPAPPPAEQAREAAGRLDWRGAAVPRRPCQPPSQAGRAGVLGVAGAGAQEGRRRGGPGRTNGRPAAAAVPGDAGQPGRADWRRPEAGRAPVGVPRPRHRRRSRHGRLEAVEVPGARGAGPAQRPGEVAARVDRHGRVPQSLARHAGLPAGRSGQDRPGHRAIRGGQGGR